MLGACTATGPKSQRVSHDAVLSRPRGVVLLVDACVQRDVLGDAGDHFLIAEAKSGAHALLGALRKYVHDSGIPVRAELVPFVCGARHGPEDSSIRAADSLNAPVRDAHQPLGVSEALAGDPQYVDALTLVSTYAFERAAVSPAKPPAGNGSGAPAGPPGRVRMEDFRVAADVIKQRTNASGMLFLGVLGRSLSAGKAVAQSVGGFFAGMATGVVTAGLGTGYYLVFVPGRHIDGRVMEGALIDLDSGELAWSNAVRAGGDPIDPKVMADPQALDLLFHDIMFKPASAAPTP